MWCPDTNESAAKRHNRLLAARLKKANILDNRVTMFICDVRASTIFNDSEKKQILGNLKFFKTS
jgi:hypothetical protein